jgi:hypothetical protein
VSSLDPEKLKNRIKIREKYNDLPSTWKKGKIGILNYL